MADEDGMIAEMLFFVGQIKKMKMASHFDGGY
jgi:hypothetical protein